MRGLSTVEALFPLWAAQMKQVVTTLASRDLLSISQLDADLGSTASPLCPRQPNPETTSIIVRNSSRKTLQPRQG